MTVGRETSKMKRLIATAAPVLMMAAVAFAGAAEARDQIRIVGSSTVYPFSTTVAEQFGKTTSFKTPVVESTGSGGGLKLFCAGIGTEHPDITNASRAIKSSEIEKCQLFVVGACVDTFLIFLLDMADIPEKSIVGIIWQLGWFGMVQNTPTGCGKKFPDLLKNPDLENVQQCLSGNYLLSHFGIVTFFYV